MGNQSNATKAVITIVVVIVATTAMTTVVAVTLMAIASITMIATTHRVTREDPVGRDLFKPADAPGLHAPAGIGLVYRCCSTKTWTKCCCACLELLTSTAEP
ncbi:hypothetical protein ACXX9E_28610, partial [Pseudomonas sp. GNP014]